MTHKACFNQHGSATEGGGPLTSHHVLENEDVVKNTGRLPHTGPKSHAEGRALPAPRFPFPGWASARSLCPECEFAGNGSDLCGRFR